MQGSVDCDDVTLTWNEVSEKRSNLSNSQTAYNLYRGDSLLNQDPIQDTSYLDENVHVGNYMYYLEMISGGHERQDYADSTEVEVEQYYGEIDMDVDNLYLSWSLENVNVQNAEFTGYAIYREGILLQEDYQSEFFILYEPPEVPRQYCIEANYSNGCTSQMAFDSVYPVSDSLFPRQNFEASVDTTDTKVDLFWDEPQNSTNTLEGYKLFRFLQPHIDDPDEWTLVEEDIDNTTYTDTNWGNLDWGLYGYALKAVYQEGNSVAVKSDSLYNECMAGVVINLEPIPSMPLDSTYYEISGNDTIISGYYGNSIGQNNIFCGNYTLMLKSAKVGPEYYVTAAFKDTTESRAQDTIPVTITKEYGSTDIQITESHINWEINDTAQVEVAGYNLYKNEELIGEMLDTESFAYEYPEETGEYVYCIVPVFADSCTGHKACDTIKATAGIDASELSDFIRIYPNPTKAKLHVESSEKIIDV